MQWEFSKVMTDGQVEAAAALFRVLSEGSRLRILRALMGGPLHVTALVEATGMKQGNVSKQLGLLTAVRLVARQRRGNFVEYSIADPMLFELCELVCGRAEREARERLEALTAD